MIFVEWIIWILQNQVFNFILLDSEIKYVLYVKLFHHNCDHITLLVKTPKFNRCSQQKFCDKAKVAE